MRVVAVMEATPVGAVVERVAPAALVVALGAATEEQRSTRTWHTRCNQSHLPRGVTRHSFRTRNALGDTPRNSRIRGHLDRRTTSPVSGGPHAGTVAARVEGAAGGATMEGAVVLAVAAAVAVECRSCCSKQGLSRSCTHSRSTDLMTRAILAQCTTLRLAPRTPAPPRTA